MPMPIPPDEPRTLEQLREQFEVERELAARLLQASTVERMSLYAEVYEELARRVPHMSQLRQKADSASSGEAVRLQRILLAPFLSSSTRLLEVGAGDCALALELCRVVHSVRAIELSRAMTAGLRPPDNLLMIGSRGGSIDLNRGTVDLAYSCHLIEHLHPDDALNHAAEVHRVLVPGGRYVCVTPNRLLGPHDVSRFFVDTASGLHLKEYDHGELADLLTRAGFNTVRVLSGVGRPPRQSPLWPCRAAGMVLGALPRRLRLRLLGLRSDGPFLPLEQVALVGCKATGRPAPQLLTQTRSASAMVR